MIVLIGDGAFTGGMVYEGMNNIGSLDNLLVVLNDNNMSIAKNVGGLSRHLSRLRVSPRYLGAKVRIKEKLARIPGGRALTQSISRTKARIKGFLLPTSLFEQMGFTYLGPVDGHDLKSVCELLAQAKKMKKPVLLHVMTQKGRGYAPSENNPEKYHGVSQFDRVTGEFLAKKKEDFSARFGAELCGLADKDARTLTIRDNGIGMTRDELEKNLGTIAESGTLAFKKEKDDKTDLIGQFGVGFYSAFMVAKKIEVTSLAYGEEQAYRWTSEGAEGYTIETAEKEHCGTEIKLYMRDKDEDCDYSEFLQEYTLRNLIKKYSDYIRYPIMIMATKSRVKDNPDKKDGDKDEYETYTELETVNSMVPLWKQKKTDITTEQYNDFYKAKFHDFTDPMRVFHFSIEGNVNYTAMLFVPMNTPYDYYQKDYKKGLQLYSNGVLIMDKCEELLPDYLGFIKGVVDSGDLSLNISREMLQHDRQLRAIANGLEKKIVGELKKFMESDRETYDKFFSEFGVSMKFGVYNNFGIKKEELKDLIEFHSSTENKLVTLKEYVGRMKEDQKYIYYACGDSVDKIDKLPQTELLKDKGYEILYMPDHVDEFVVKTLMNYDEKEFRSVGAKDLGLESDAEKEEIKTKSEENKELTDFIKEALDGEVKDVRLSRRMKNNAVCLTADGEVSLEMEKVFKNMKNSSPVPVVAEKVLEINPDHKIFAKLQDLYANDKEALKLYAKLLYAEALIGEGMEIAKPDEFVAALTEVLSK